MSLTLEIWVWLEIDPTQFLTLHLELSLLKLLEMKPILNHSSMLINSKTIVLVESCKMNLILLLCHQIICDCAPNSVWPCRLTTPIFASCGSPLYQYENIPKLNIYNTFLNFSPEAWPSIFCEIAQKSKKVDFIRWRHNDVSLQAKTFWPILDLKLGSF